MRTHDRFGRLEDIRGLEAVKLAYQSHAAAIDFIEHTARDESISCDFTRLDGYLIPGTGETAAGMEREEAAARRAGVPVERNGAAAFQRFQVGPCLKFPNQGQFHPLKYLAGLARAVRERGGRIFTNVRVQR